MDGPPPPSLTAPALSPPAPIPTYLCANSLPLPGRLTWPLFFAPSAQWISQSLGADPRVTQPGGFAPLVLSSDSPLPGCLTRPLSNPKPHPLQATFSADPGVTQPGGLEERKQRGLGQRLQADIGSHTLFRHLYCDYFHTFTASPRHQGLVK